MSSWCAVGLRLSIAAFSGYSIPRYTEAVYEVTRLQPPAYLGLVPDGQLWPALRLLHAATIRQSVASFHQKLSST